jgi:hypothetical protein
LEVPDNYISDSGASNLRPRSSTIGASDAEMMKREKQSNGPCSLSAGNSQQQLCPATTPSAQPKTSPMMNM